VGHLDGLFGGLGLGLFGQFRNFGESREVGVVFGGAVGLKGAELLDGAVVGALRASLVAGEAVEDSGFFAAEEIFEIAAADFGFDAAEALEIPGGVEDLAEGDGFEGALGVELGFEGVAELGEVVFFIAADDEMLRGEAVFEGVLGDAGFAFGRDRAGGVERVGSVGG
jgi:hypothetical protein